MQLVWCIVVACLLAGGAVTEPAEAAESYRAHLDQQVLHAPVARRPHATLPDAAPWVSCLAPTFGPPTEIVSLLEWHLLAPVTETSRPRLRARGPPIARAVSSV